MQWATNLPWGVILEHSRTYALPVSSVYVAYKFGRSQAAIGRRQATTASLSMQTARNKLRLDLFEKRFSVFEAAETIIQKAKSHSSINSSDIDKYLSDVKTATWLFDKGTAKFLTYDIYMSVYSIVQASEEFKKTYGTADHDSSVRTIKKYQEELHKYEINLHILMKPYLLFTDKLD
ncbi:hypothetical protein [Comamonas thiooxydans]|uniref:hypothetical protein n=1 Tax=Comamonas thiooxydans TaxID=363952 RepID=UPI001038B621|nr:hypothetical protein [Comamonas thiooxydans]